MEQDRMPRWQFRKKKKIEKRRAERQKLAKEKESVKPNISLEESIAEKETYKRQKAQWEANEKKFELLELAKKKTKEKQEQEKLEAEKRWKEALLNLPLTNVSRIETKSTFKTFVQPQDIPSARKTYRERFNEAKANRKSS
ncbi:uncharacterized protein B0P05DRAFT_371631 [Gilbertella persicaria]|uniref:uncharacterized protein n=1 Tax=Gilbertella persicaria TaxID=101096 RepID=UPI0022202CB6|nr:uncharacterized protein B0P05DRAFT_371631 [Gilbertella persicaria]KAI8087709.1 hypothetical protein B0P05DRAFT_371631 [Gilbertella persicaria]